ncbi:hypothetical protein CNR22_08930 [Sphingobacteriaceae bacterium]|nr:hypothetical protein CNR22_08930 [Sphingobacteriaceae bacterium]
MKYIKRFFIGLFILLFLTGAAIFVTITFYKKELNALLIENLKVNYGLDLKVADIRVTFFDNWPHASMQLKDIYIASELNGKSEPILKAGSLSLSFNMEKMFHKQFVVKYISMSDAEILLQRNEDGTRNFEFKKQPHDTAKHTGISFEVNKISLEHVKFAFKNKEKKQNIAIDFKEMAIRLKQYSDGVEATLRGKSVVEELLFNEKNGAFLKQKRAILDLDINYIFDRKTMCILPSSQAEIEDQTYYLTSLINLGENQRLALQIKGEKLKVEKVAELLTPKIKKVLSNFEVKRPIDAKILLVVNLGKKEDPVILAEVIGENCDLAIGHSKIPYSGVFFTGKIRSLDSTGQRGDMEHASIVFEPLKGKVYDFPFKATVKVNNLTKPDIAIEADLLIEANKIPYEVSKDLVLKGSATAKLHYSGPTDMLNKAQFLQSPMSLTAYLTFKNLSYKELDRAYVYTLNGNASLNNRDLQFDNLRVKTDIADALVKGKAEGFVPYLFGLSKGFKAEASARTEKLDLNPLFVKSDTPAPEKDKTTKESTSASASKISQGHFEFNINLFAKKLIFRKIEGSNANVDLSYRGNALNIKSASINTCDGKIVAKASVQNFEKVNADMTIQNVNVTKLFEQFENFGQEAIVSSNLKGNMTVEAKFKTDLDEKMNLKPETMAGDVKLKLVNGHLINYEPVQSLSNFLFRNRDFNDVEFTELVETFKLRGYEMQIEELEIGSNILNLYVVDGLYNFKGESNMNLLIPWSNLKKRGKNYIPKSSGESAENTKGVKLNFSGPSKKMKLSFGHKDQTKKFS